MRLALGIAAFLFGFLGVLANGQLQLGVQNAAAFNPLKYCIKECISSESTSVAKCRKDQCEKLKSKNAKAKCDRACNKPQGLLEFCDRSCKKSQMCSRGLEMKSCLKEKCDPYKKSDIRRYIECKKEECSKICK